MSGHMQTPAKSAAWLAILLIAVDVSLGHAARVPTGDGPHEVTPSVRITSPLGRTGTPATIRIVAQIEWPASDDNHAPPLHVVFSVDGNAVGTVDSGPPYAVSWDDDNPFEAREIVVEATDAMNRVARDDVKLPAFDLTDRTEVRSILVEAAVYDDHGRPVSTLQPSDFALRENGELQTLDLVKPETLPTTTLLLVDSSQSMARRYAAVRHAVAQVARALSVQDRVLIAPFNAHIGAVTGPTNDAATIEESVDAMKAGGGTAILNALEDGTRLLDGIEGRRAIILLTDGFDENSTIDASNVLTAVAGAQVTVYTVSLDGINGVSLEGERLLRHLTETTGGRAFFPWRDSDLASVAKQVVDDAHSRYLITYTPANQQKDGKWRSIALDLPPGYHARARAGYQASLPPPIRPTIEFTVRDRNESYIDDIAVNDLEVDEDGVTQHIDTFQEAVDPVSIELLLDASGSMVRAADTVKATARQFVAAVRPEDRLALMTFSDEPHDAHVTGTDRKATLDAIDTYVAAGGTALYDALWNALTQLKTVQGRRAIVVLTDGRDENNPGTAPGSAHTLDDVLELDRQAGAAVFAIGLGTRVDRSVLLKLADESGGDAYFSGDASQLFAQFQNIVENLRRRYVLSYTSTNVRADGQWRHVDIHAPARALVVRSAGGYFAPE